ncbi:MAG: hypothetical protein KGI50_00575 [Patescibacteria group bacterium]|nr:hypothetical protein [Patescibacteria group bacterium]MDE2438149.1 hypothetical protein [Patescibacteria group bacterium]
MDTRTSFSSRVIICILYGIGAFIIILAVFQLGIFIGYHKASVAYQRGRAYYQAFNNPRYNIAQQYFPSANGAVGTITSINLPTFIVEGRDNIETTIRLSSTTALRKFRDVITPTDLHINDHVIVIGSSDEAGVMHARLVRIVPGIASSTMARMPHNQ